MSDDVYRGTNVKLVVYGYDESGKATVVSTASLDRSGWIAFRLEVLEEPDHKRFLCGGCS